MGGRVGDGTAAARRARSWEDGPGVGPWDRRAAAARLGLAVALLACAALPIGLLVVQGVVFGTSGGRSLLWNLLLAGVPLALALAVDWSAAGRRWVATSAWLVVWLAFFPNAPYLVTELVDLSAHPPSPLWLDALILASAMLTGLLVAFASLRLVQLVVARVIGPVWSWVAALAVLFLSGFGVYLGRFGRFNSWDLLTRPRSVLYAASDGTGAPLPTRGAVAVTLLFSSLLIVGYLVVVAIASLSGGRAGGPGGGRG